MLVRRIEPVPAAHAIGTRQLLGIDDDAPALRRQVVHRRASGEVGSVLRAPVQHHDHRQQPLVGPRRQVQPLRVGTSARREAVCLRRAIVAAQRGAEPQVPPRDFGARVPCTQAVPETPRRQQLPRGKAQHARWLSFDSHRSQLCPRSRRGWRIESLLISSCRRVGSTRR